MPEFPLTARIHLNAIYVNATVEADTLQEAEAKFDAALGAGAHDDEITTAARTAKFESEILNGDQD